jgi:PAS domain S-box-containing protein
MTKPLTDNHYRRLLDAAPDGIVEVDASGRIILANSQVERMFGYKREELLGQRVEMLVPERFRGRHPANRNATVRTRPFARWDRGWTYERSVRMELNLR